MSLTSVRVGMLPTSGPSPRTIAAVGVLILKNKGTSPDAELSGGGREGGPPLDKGRRRASSGRPNGLYI